MKRDQTHLLQHPISTKGGDIVAEGGQDDEQCFYSVRCDAVSVSGQHRMDLREGLDFVLCSVKGHRTSPVMI